jgi:hypothetical protein
MAEVSLPVGSIATTPVRLAGVSQQCRYRRIRLEYDVPSGTPGSADWFPARTPLLAQKRRDPGSTGASLHMNADLINKCHETLSGKASPVPLETANGPAAPIRSGYERLTTSD